MIRYTPQYLKKLEDLLKENHYEVRYEKGNFKSGYCILEAKKVVVVNKFSTIESRIQSLYEIAQMLIAQGKISSGGMKISAASNDQAPSYIAEADEAVNESAESTS